MLLLLPPLFQPSLPTRCLYPLLLLLLRLLRLRVRWRWRQRLLQVLLLGLLLSVWRRWRQLLLLHFIRQRLQLWRQLPRDLLKELLGRMVHPRLEALLKPWRPHVAGRGPGL